MEKKGNRTVQGTNKGLGTSDSKKNQDVAGGKIWPRGGRRREPSGGSFPAKTETSRKCNPQRTKTLLDKRPRARGAYGPATSNAGKESARLEDEEEPELGSVFMQGSKKQSLNHLLNFHYTPRDAQQHVSNRQNKGNNCRWLTTGKHKYNKEHFIQANCQFIVNSSGDYKQYMNNPDALVDWSLIEQVNLQVHELPSCPICLYPPIAAKMTRCGHIYCWSCVLHYLSLSDKTYRKCPICFESVHRQDLKSVVPIPHSSFNVNETITFKLMKRARGSLIAYPAIENIEEDKLMFNMSDKIAYDIYCKLLMADANDIMSIIDREKCELQEQLLEDCPENCFIEEAITSLKERENFILSNIDNDLHPIMAKLTTNDVNADEINFNSETSNSNQAFSKYYYFYQAMDGQHIYLHAVNARMLEDTYGSLEYSPKSITGRIVEKEGGSMTEDLRKRLRYLQHLPVTCQFEVAEIQLGPPVISKETCDAFSDQLDIRKKRRQRKARDEKRREKRIAEEENRQMGKFPSVNIELESHYQFPEFGSEHGRERTVSETTLRSASPISNASLESGCEPRGMEYSGPSFAKMLTSAKQPSWPKLKSEAAQCSYTPLQNIKGSKEDSQSEYEQNEDYVSVPEYNRSFSDAIALALEKASKNNGNENNGDCKSGKKKKKNKQKILFATTMAYSGN